MKRPRRPHRGVMLERSNERVLPPDYAGDVLFWDIDKTYLDTRFSSWRGLLAIPFEFAVDKQTISGAPALLRALRRGAGAESAIVPLYFVSGSPPQLRRVVERRMMLDGVDFDGITFKDQLSLLLTRRFAEIRAQVGYKLMALLSYCRELPPKSHFLCFGDDVESDAATFTLLGEVCAELRGAALAYRLAGMGVPQANIAAIVEVAAPLPRGFNPVGKIFIHLERRTPPSQFVDPRIVATHSYIQTALVLHKMQRISNEAVATVARDLRLRGMPEQRLQAHLQDAKQRFHIESDALALAQGVQPPGHHHATGEVQS